MKSELKQTLLILMLYYGSMVEASSMSFGQASSAHTGFLSLSSVTKCKTSTNQHQSFYTPTIATRTVSPTNDQCGHTGNNFHSNFALYVSRSKTLAENVDKHNNSEGRRKKKKGKIASTSLKKGQRMNKSEINDLVRGMLKLHH